MVALLSTAADALVGKTEGALTIAGNFAVAVKSIAESAVEAGQADRPSLGTIDKKSVEPART
jgi:hypothetical protein